MTEAWRALADHLPTGIAVTAGADHTIRYRNPAFRPFVRESAGNGVGRPLFAVAADGFLEKVKPPLDRVCSTGQGSAHVDVELPGKGEGPVVFRCVASPLALHGKAQRGAVLQCHDISEHAGMMRSYEAAEREVRAVNELLVTAAVREQKLAGEAEAASKAKSEFLSVVSHELRTPLTAIIGHAELLQHETVGPLNEQQVKSIARIGASARHLAGLINEILSFQKLESAAMVRTSTPTDARELARQACSMVEGLAAGRLDFRLHLPDHPVPMVTDSQKLRQVLVNLLTNAIKFTEKGFVELRVRASNGKVHFLVEDSGIGIEPSRFEDIFRPFTQLSTGFARTSEGTGLGLSISRSLVDLLGGEIRVESTPGEGSTLSVVLPREFAEARGESRSS